MKKRIIEGVLGLMVLTGINVKGAEPSSESVEARVAQLEEQLSMLQQEQSLAEATKKTSKFRFGGYGEIHANFEENSESILDLHRLVFYLGYDFNEWIKLNSEIELEHASTDEEYLLIEQLAVDFLLSPAFNVRAGRVLTPMGIVNIRHEPPLFNGVERPNVEKYIIPSTWMFDGLGIFGTPSDYVTYEAYVGAGLDGSEFSDRTGVRGGRMTGRPGLNDPAVVGRIDVFPLLDIDTEINQDLRLGISGIMAGTNNKNKGGKHGVENTFSMVSADSEYTLGRVELRGLIAWGQQSAVDDLNTTYGKDVGKEIFGWYVETGVHVMPESWKSGKLENADLIPFIRYEEYDTQHAVSGGVVDNDDNQRTEITIGCNIELTSQFVAKVDYQFMDSKGAARNNQFNLGLGWHFN